MTWRAQDAQEGEEGACLNCFSGGPAAAKALAMGKADRDRAYGELLNKLYAGFTDNFVKSRFMDWPNDPWTQTGYSFPRARPGHDGWPDDAQGFGSSPLCR
jgi:monoamine oxidase